MSTLETNSIGKYSGNNVSIDDSLNLKSYTTTQRDALTSVAGDMIYNSTDSKVQVYTGSTWENLGGTEAVSTQLLIIGGGGGMNNVAQGSGGAGAGEFIDEEIFLSPSTNYTVTVGGGGSSGGTNGSPSSVGELSATDTDWTQEDRVSLQWLQWIVNNDIDALARELDEWQGGIGGGFNTLIPPVLIKAGEFDLALKLMRAEHAESGWFHYIQSVYMLTESGFEPSDEFRKYPGYRAFFEESGFGQIARERIANGQTAGLPLNEDGTLVEF